MREMALNGYILHVDLAPVKELVSLQRRCANNLNQVAVHANTFACTQRRSLDSRGTMKSSGGRVSDVLTELSALVKNDFEGCGYYGLHPSFLFVLIPIILSRRLRI